MWINHGNTSSRTFLARTRNDLLERQIALWVSLAEWTYCAHSVVLSFYLQMGPSLWGFCVFSEPETCPHLDHLRKYIIYFWKVHWSGKVWLGWIHSWCNFRGSLETSVWSTQHARERYVFILNRLWLSLHDTMHCMTQHGIWTHNWISFGDWIQLYSRFSTHLLPVSTSHEFEPLTLITFNFNNSRCFICVHHPWLYNSGFCQFCMHKLVHQVYTDSKLGWEPVFFFISFFNLKNQQISKITHI
jgi:hypothetical protein